MITVEKNGVLTDILEVFKDKYIKAGWKETTRPEVKIEDDATKIIAGSIDNKEAAKSRKRDLTKDKQSEAAAIVAQELRKKEKNTFTDGLIKE